jgi:hypothetical protein
MGKKCLVWYLVAAMFIIGIAPRLEAAFSPSDALLLDSATQESDLQKIQRVLENRLVSQRLQDLGFTTDEIRERLAQLSAEQTHSLVQKIDDLKVGQDGLGVVIFLLVVVIVVLIVLMVTGKRVVVTQ